MSHSSQISTSVNWEKRARESQTLSKKLYCWWKTFQKSEQQAIKSYIGLTIFGIKEGDEATHHEVNDYYSCYDRAQKKLIDNIYNQLEFDESRIMLAHTYLCLSLNDEVVRVFRQIRPNDEITFIDQAGRVYTSWEHFIKTNNLPKCDFFAPDDGVYAVNGKLRKYRSSAKRTSRVLAQAGDVAAAGLTVGAVSLVALATAPVTAVVMGAAGAAYAFGRSIGTLVDRSDHKQSIAPNNLEAAVSWANIGATALIGISTVGLANSTRIVAMSGKYSSIAETSLKGLNYATLFAGSGFNVGMNLIHLSERQRNGELSTKDVLEFCVSIFLMYGAVQNVRQMHNHLSNLNKIEVNAPPKSLSRTAKRRLCRSRAKLRLNGGTTTTTSNPNVMKAGKQDFNLAKWSFPILSVGGHMISQHFPSANRIHYTCEEIRNTVVDFRNQRLPLKIFISNMINHAYNLYSILREELEKLKDPVLQFLRPYFGANAPSQLTHDVAGIIDNSVTALNNVDEELPEPDDNDESNTPEDDRAKYEIILDLVQRRVGFIETNDDASAHLIKTFTNEFSQVIRRITSQVQKYDENISYNVSVLGEEKAKLMFSEIGINSKIDFAEKVFGKIVEDMKCSSPPVTQRSAVLNKLITIIHEIFVLVSGEIDVKKMSVQETCEILEKLISTFMEPFTKNYSFASDFYAKNLSLYGKNFPLVVFLKALDIKDDCDIGPILNQDTIFDIALKKTNLSEVIRKSSVVTFSDEFKIENLLPLCSSIYQKINPTLDHSLREKNLKMVCDFITHKFSIRFKYLENKRTDLKKISQKFKLNESHDGKPNFAHNINKREVFDQVMKEFQNEDTISDLIDEYFQEMSSRDDVNVEVCKNIVEDFGMKIHTIEMERYVGWDKYKAKAAHLFNLRENTIRPISKTDDLVILQSDNKYVMFQFIEKENRALIMQVDSLVSEIKE